MSLSAGAPHRQLGGDTIHNFVGQPCAHLCAGDKAGRYSIYRDPLWTVFERQGRRWSQQTRLGRDIAGNTQADAARQRAVGADIDDTSAIFRVGL